MEDFSRSKWYNTLMILLGLVFIVLGTVMLAGNRQIYNFTGRPDFIEDHFRAGTPASANSCANSPRPFSHATR